LGPGPGNLNQNGQKPTPLMMSPTKTQNIFFQCNLTRLAKSFEGLESPLAQSTGELWSCKVA